VKLINKISSNYYTHEVKEQFLIEYKKAKISPLELFDKFLSKFKGEKVAQLRFIGFIKY